jgi:hypothetical protein
MFTLRRLRALIVFSAVWGIAWTLLGASIAIVNTLRQGLAPSFTILLAGIPMVAGIGAFCGLVFGIAFGAGERSRPFEALSIGRAVGWGVLGALVIPLVAALLSPPSSILGLLGIVVPFALLGGLSGGVMLLVARRAPQTLPPPAAPAAISGERPSAP